MIGRAYGTKVPLLGLSFVISMSLFLFVQLQTVPAQSPIPIRIKVQKLNVPPNLSAELVTTSVLVYVDGPQSEVNSLSEDPSLAIADVDLSHASTKVHSYDVTIGKPSNLPDLRLKLLTPSVRVNLSRIINKVVSVKAEATRQFQEKGIILDSIVFRPDRVTLTGPENLIEGTLAVAPLDLSKINPDKEIETKIVIKDENGAILPEVTSNPEDVVATFSTHPAPEQKQVVLYLTWKGTLPPGIRIVDVKIVPQAVTITGPSEILAMIATAPVEVNLTGLSASKNFALRPKLPVGVRLKGNQSTRVFVTVAPVALPSSLPPQSSVNSKPSTTGSP